MTRFLAIVLTLSMILGTLGCASTKFSKATLPEQPNFKPVTVGMPGKGKMGAYAAGRMAAFEKEDVAKLQGCIAFVGDSITERFPVEKYFPGQKVANRGIGGDTMGGSNGWGLMDRLDACVYNLNPKTLILMIGINDIVWVSSQSVEDKILRHDYLLWTLRKNLPNTKIYVVSCTPCKGKYAKYNEQTLKFNAGMKAHVQKYGIKYIDIYDLFKDEKGMLKEDLAADDIHLSPKGYELITTVYNKEILNKK